MEPNCLVFVERDGKIIDLIIKDKKTGKELSVDESFRLHQPLAPKQIFKAYRDEDKNTLTLFGTTDSCPKCQECR